MIHINNSYFDSIFFYNKNKIHRENGPAVINGNRQEWWLNGKIHRLDGPAVIDGNFQSWYIEGYEYTEIQFNEKLKLMGIVS